VVPKALGNGLVLVSAPASVDILSAGFDLGISNPLYTFFIALLTIETLMSR